MKKQQQLTLFLLISASSTAFASGMHAGGHGGDHSMPMAAHWMAPPAEAAKVNPIQRSKDSIAKGAELFQQNCVSCHGSNADGSGMAGKMLDTTPANLVAMSGLHPDGDFAYKIKVGRGSMPAWGSTLNEHQVWHLVNFIQALEKQPVATQEESSDHEHSTNHQHGS